MHNLSIDLETFSSEPIAKTGLYKYVQSRDFQVLLFAYSLDNAPVQVLDLTREELPEWLKAALYDSAYIKHAFNAAFEWYALGKHFGRELPLEQWRCTMLHSLYCGYPASLDAAGKALGLPHGVQKLTTGKALIKYFCTPCAKTITNGGRTRNLPEHDPAKWELFVEYNRQDVVTEMEIERRLSRFPVPEQVQREWEYDMRISARGVAADRELVDGALYCGTAIEEAAKREAIELTGLENPKSREQMLTWLQFYGANRTGRWAGRLVQVQNLPRTYLHGAMLDTARDLTRRKLPEGLELLYGSVPGTLSQLVRTALVPRPGCKFVDADFSAIEARVVAWLAGEEWVLQVFRTHGKIYEATASQMFGVPLDRIVKGNPEYALRQKGKVATLALGYQGGSSALIAMGALKNGLTEEELPDIVSRWRQANRAIVRCWKAVEQAAIQAVETGRSCATHGLVFAREADIDSGLDFLTIRLPSGRKLYYAQPHFGINQWGGKQLRYYGMNQMTKKWSVIETYGGHMTENIVQAIARDCLAVNIERLENAGFPIVFHIHDEVVIEVPEDRADLDEVTRIMGQPIEWAPGLPLAADGWVGDYFTKD